MSDDNLACLAVVVVTLAVLAGWELFKWLDRRAERIVREKRFQSEQEHDRQWREYQARQFNDVLRNDLSEFL